MSADVKTINTLMKHNPLCHNCELLDEAEMHPKTVIGCENCEVLAKSYADDLWSIFSQYDAELFEPKPAAGESE